MPDHNHKSQDKDYQKSSHMLNKWKDIYKPAKVDADTIKKVILKDSKKKVIKKK